MTTKVPYNEDVTNKNTDEPVHITAHLHSAACGDRVGVEWSFIREHRGHPNDAM